MNVTEFDVVKRYICWCCHEVPRRN